MHDVIVCDEEFEQAASVISTTCSQIEELVTTYLFLMERVSDCGVVSGQTAEALSTYISCARKLKDVLSVLAQHNSLVSRNFLRAIDEADRYLF